MGTSVIDKTRVSGSRDIVTKTVKNHAIHPFAKRPVSKWFHIKWAFLPMLERGKSFLLHEFPFVNVGSSGHFFDHPQYVNAVGSILVKPGMVDSKFPTGYVQCSQGFQRFGRPVVQGIAR